MVARVRGRPAAEGSATVWLVMLMALVWMAAVVVVHAGTARVARHRAQSAADLSALAAAAWALAAPGRACERARMIALANRARMESCSLSNGVADVSVSVRTASSLAGARVVTVTAKAGPVEAKE